MNLFSRYHKWRDKPGPGVYEDIPNSSYKRFVFILKTHFSIIIKLNFLFLVFCIPVFTIPASLAGMTRVLILLTRNGYCYLWEDFWKEFKICFMQRMFVWLLFITVPVVIAMLFWISGLKGIVVGLLIALGAVSFIIQCYYFPLIAIVDVSLTANIKNAIALVILEWKRSLLLLIVAGGIQGVCFLLFPYSIPLLLFILFSFTWLFISVVVNEPIGRTILKV